MKSKIQKFKNNLIFFYVILLVFTIILCCSAFSMTTNMMNSVKFIGIIGGLLFFAYIILQYKISGTFLNFGFIFSILLFLFCFGQFLLYGFGIEYDYFFMNSHYRSFFGNDDYYLLYGEVVTIISIACFWFAMLLTTNKIIKPKRVSSKPTVSDMLLQRVSLIVFCISAVIMIPFKLYLLLYSIANGGYLAVYDINTPMIVRIVGVFFVPSAIALLISYKNKRQFKWIVLILSLYAIVGLLTGGRSEPIVLMSGVALTFLFGKKFSFRNKACIVILLYVIATLLVVVANNRVAENRGLLNIIKLFFSELVSFRAVIQLIGEMGFSGSSMIWTVYIVRIGQQELFYGMTYLSDILNMIPSSLDFLGLLNAVSKYAYVEDWLTETLNFNFGVGFSLIAEAYLNAGIMSVAVMFIYGLILNKIFNHIHDDNHWGQYKAIVMLAVLMTLPRRATMYFTDQWVLCIICIWILCNIVRHLFYSESIKQRKMIATQKQS